MTKFYSITQEAREANVYIFGDIVLYPWDESDTSSRTFLDEISDIDADVIHVHVNSYGGAVSEGWAIYNALKAHPAKIVTHADGFVASAALYPYLAGEERTASTLSGFFLHQVMVGIDYANADELRAAADEADKLNDIGLRAFAAAGIDPEKILELEKAETWLNADEALALGIATTITAEQAPREQQSIRRQLIQLLTGARAAAPQQAAAEPQQAAPETAPPAAAEQSDPEPVSSVFQLLAKI